MKALLLFLVGSMLAASAVAADLALITVKGESTIEVQPDFVRINVVVSGRDKNAQSAKSDVDVRARDLVETIRAFEIQDADLAFSGVSVTRSYDYDRNDNERFVGYEVDRSVEIKLRDLKAYEAFVEALTRAGVNEVGTPRADVDDPHKLKTSALKEAALNAKRKAAEIAEGLGVSVGRPFEIGEDRLPSQLPFSQRRADRLEIEEVVVTASRAGISDPILFVPENIKVNATVWVSFEIDEG